MFLLTTIFLFASAFLVAAAPQAQIPSLKTFTESSSSGFRLDSKVRIIVDPSVKDSGSPSLLSFARTFRGDLVSLTGFNDIPEVAEGTLSDSSTGTIFLTLGTTSEHKLFNGQKTGEGYDIEITTNSYVIKGAEAIGAWWGTRTLLQQVALIMVPGGQDFITLPAGSGSDTPGWEVRGFMLDAGRHWFEPSFIADLCIYASFFKLQTLHIHASDNTWNEQTLAGPDWRSLYAGFRFRPSDGSPIAGLVPAELRDETWTKDEFQAIQSTCSDHGVTLVPEVDTPGHSLVITKWKEELMIKGAPDHLDLSHPDTIPTIKSIWDEILPWFTSAEVSIGADEYEPSLADLYVSFVNEMARYVTEKSGKSIRVWGTNEPSQSSSLSTDITIQHWQFPTESVPNDLMKKGYKIINSEEKFLYLDGKLSFDNNYPFELGPKLWSGAPGGKGWAPNIFSATDASNNTSIDNPLLRGSIMALWNDWGNDAATPLEIYYQLAKSLAVFSEKVWAGSEARDTALTQSDFERVYPRLNAAAPGQNLNRAVKLDNGIASVFQDDTLPSPTQTSFESVGPPYILSFSVQPKYASQVAVSGFMGAPIIVPVPSGSVVGDVIFSGKDSRLHAKNLAFEDTTSNTRYALDFDPPEDTFTKVEIHATRNQTYALINGSSEKHFYKAHLDMWGLKQVDVDMSFAAPSHFVGNSAFAGELKDVKLVRG